MSPSEHLHYPHNKSEVNVYFPWYSINIGPQVRPSVPVYIPWDILHIYRSPSALVAYPLKSSLKHHIFNGHFSSSPYSRLARNV